MTEFDKFVTVRGHKRGGSTALVRASLARGHDDPTLELSPCVTPVPAESSRSHAQPLEDADKSPRSKRDLSKT